uniref:Reverse transcriptase domain-containing protein n=1 Tax=Ananas comosus var. bracteatus TaxID=296719 RepID=A0A6V7NP26_ANACO|nr:unnamed protein product [Ananas comosus var. bracteatus]
MSTFDAGVIDTAGDPPRQLSKQGKSKEPLAITKDSVPLEDRLALLEDIMSKMSERALNKVTVKNKYHIPLVVDLFDQLGTAKYFTKLDLYFGYYQVWIAEGVEKEKCIFAKEEMHFLGHLIGQGLIRIDKRKVRAICKWENPTTLSEMRSFLGLVKLLSPLHCRAEAKAEAVVVEVRMAVPSALSAEALLEAKEVPEEVVEAVEEAVIQLKPTGDKLISMFFTLKPAAADQSEKGGTQKPSSELSQTHYSTCSDEKTVQSDDFASPKMETGQQEICGIKRDLRKSQLITNQKWRTLVAGPAVQRKRRKEPQRMQGKDKHHCFLILERNRSFAVSGVASFWCIICKLTGFVNTPETK